MNVFQFLNVLDYVFLSLFVISHIVIINALNLIFYRKGEDDD